MSPIAIVVLVVLLNWWSFRMISRRLAQKRGVPAPKHRPGHRRAIATPPTPPATASVARAEEPTAMAFPIYGLPPGLGSAGVLEGLLRHLAGVTRAYVSPVTALAYVDFLPAQVTEAQLVVAIRGGGYRVGDPTQRFDWRHRHVAAADLLGVGAVGAAQAPPAADA